MKIRKEAKNMNNMNNINEKCLLHNAISTENKKNKKGLFLSIVFSTVFSIFLSFLSGCAGMNNQFDCNVDSGGKCLSMDQINKMASSGMFNR